MLGRREALETKRRIMTAVVMRMIHGQKWHLVNEKRSLQQKLLHERGRAVRFYLFCALILSAYNRAQGDQKYQSSTSRKWKVLPSRVPSLQIGSLPQSCCTCSRLIMTQCITVPIIYSNTLGIVSSPTTQTTYQKPVRSPPWQGSVLQSH